MSRAVAKNAAQDHKGGYAGSRYFYIRDGTDLAGMRDRLAFMRAKRWRLNNRSTRLLKGCGCGRAARVTHA